MCAMLNLSEVLCPEYPFRVGSNQSFAIGDHVMIGHNRGPVYKILAVFGSQAWVRPLTNGQEGMAELDRLRPVEVAG